MGERTDVPTRIIEKRCYIKFIIHLPVWLRNRLVSAGLEPVLSSIEKNKDSIVIKKIFHHEY